MGAQTIPFAEARRKHGLLELLVSLSLLLLSLLQLLYELLLQLLQLLGLTLILVYESLFPSCAILILILELAPFFVLKILNMHYGLVHLILDLLRSDGFRL